MAAKRINLGDLPPCADIGHNQGGTLCSVEDVPVRSQHYGDHKNFEGSTSVFCHMCNKHHPTQSFGQPEASTDAETATLDHHRHDSAFSLGLVGSVSLLTDSMTNA